MSKMKGYLPLICISFIYILVIIIAVKITDNLEAQNAQVIDNQVMYNIMLELDSDEEESQRIFDSIEIPDDIYKSTFERAKNSLYYVNTEKGRAMTEYEYKVGDTIEIGGNQCEVLEFRVPTDEELNDYVTYVLKSYLYKDAVASEALKIYSKRINK